MVEMPGDKLDLVIKPLEQPVWRLLGRSRLSTKFVYNQVVGLNLWKLANFSKGKVYSEENAGNPRHYLEIWNSTGE